MSQNYRAKTAAVVRAIGDLDLTNLRGEVQIKGIDCTWEKASMCPCYQIGTLQGSDVANATTTMPRGNCPACKGSGWLYYGSQTARFLLNGATSSMQIAGAEGYAQPGTVGVTAFVEQPLSVGDRITVNGAVRTVQQQFTRQGTTDTLRFPIVTKAWTIGSALDPNVPEVVNIGVDYVVAASPSTGEIVGGATPTEYVQGVSFTVSGGLLDWTIGGVNVPPVGARCSIRYYARPRYIVTVDPYTHRQLGFVEFRPARQEVQLFWRGQAVLESLGTAP